MNVGVYFLRVFKYLLRMVILLSAVFALMLVTGTSEVSAEVFISNLFDTEKGSILLIALIAVALTYPKFGYVKRTIIIDFTSNRDGILQILNKSGYSLYAEEESKITLRATSPFKRVIMLGDDKMTLNKERNSIIIEGVRKDVAMAEYRLKTLSEKE